MVCVASTNHPDFIDPAYFHAETALENLKGRNVFKKATEDKNARGGT